LRGRCGAELGDVCLAEHDEPGVAKAAAERGVGGRAVVDALEDAVAEPERHARGDGADVLHRNGTPANGAVAVVSIWRASSRASWKRVQMTALSCGLRASMRAMASPTSSSALTAPLRTSWACSVASASMAEVASVTARQSSWFV